jgi:hypothetical protein
MLPYRICLDRYAAGLCVLYQPSPPTSLNTRERCIELCLELIQTAVATIDGLCQRSGWRLASSLALGSQIFPEQTVIEVAT